MPRNVEQPHASSRCLMRSFGLDSAPVPCLKLASLTCLAVGNSGGRVDKGRDTFTIAIRFVYGSNRANGLFKPSSRCLRETRLKPE